MTRLGKWEQCKIEAADNVKNKVELEGSIRKALSAVSSESGIPVGTLKRWVYPEIQEKYEEKRRGKKKVKKDKVLSETDHTSNPEPEQVSGISGKFDRWNSAMNRCLDFGSGILNGKISWKTEEEKRIVQVCFESIDEFMKLYAEKARTKKIKF